MNQIYPMSYQSRLLQGTPTEASLPHLRTSEIVLSDEPSETFSSYPQHQLQVSEGEVREVFQGEGPARRSRGGSSPAGMSRLRQSVQEEAGTLIKTFAFNQKKKEIYDIFFHFGVLLGYNKYESFFYHDNIERRHSPPGSASHDQSRLGEIG